VYNLSINQPKQRTEVPQPQQKRLVHFLQLITNTLVPAGASAWEFHPSVKRALIQHDKSLQPVDQQRAAQQIHHWIDQINQDYALNIEPQPAYFHHPHHAKIIALLLPLLCDLIKHSGETDQQVAPQLRYEPTPEITHQLKQLLEEALIPRPKPKKSARPSFFEAVMEPLKALEGLCGLLMFFGAFFVDFTFGLDEEPEWDATLKSLRKLKPTPVKTPKPQPNQAPANTPTLTPELSPDAPTLFNKPKPSPQKKPTKNPALEPKILQEPNNKPKVRSPFAPQLSPFTTPTLKPRHLGG
jgi:hypothetical protein